MIFFENSDGRICIVFPYLGNVLAGSTDIRISEVTRVRCETEERDYILDSLRLVFPEIRVAAADVVFSFSGIRPLPKSDHDFTGRISRGHFVERLDGSPPQLCMVGGKWTTFRAFAEETADAALKELRRPRLKSTLIPADRRRGELPVRPRHIHSQDGDGLWSIAGTGGASYEHVWHPGRCCGGLLQIVSMRRALG